LTVDQKAARTSVTLTPDTHDRAVKAGINISAVCEAAIRQKLNKYATLGEVQTALTDELHSLEKELGPNLSEKQQRRFANVRKTINRLEGDAFMVKDK